MRHLLPYYLSRKRFLGDKPAACAPSCPGLFSLQADSIETPCRNTVYASFARNDTGEFPKAREESFSAHWECLASPICELQIGFKDAFSSDECTGIDDTPLCEELRERVLFLAVVFRSLQHLCRWPQLFRLPGETPLYGPPQDARPLLPQLIKQLLVLVSRGNHNIERHEKDCS